MDRWKWDLSAQPQWDWMALTAFWHGAVIKRVPFADQMMLTKAWSICTSCDRADCHAVIKVSLENPSCPLVSLPILKLERTASHRLLRTAYIFHKRDDENLARFPISQFVALTLSEDVLLNLRMSAALRSSLLQQLVTEMGNPKSTAFQSPAAPCIL